MATALIDADVIVKDQRPDHIWRKKRNEALYITTAVVTKVIEDLVAEGKQYDRCIAIGPMIMMKFACQEKKLNIPTIISERS